MSRYAGSSLKRKKPSWKSHLGFALKVKGQHVFPGSCLALTNDKEAVAPGPPRQHQLGRTNSGQRAMEPRITCQAAVALRLFQSVT